MKDIYKIHTDPLCCTENMVIGGHYRFTVLTSAMIRLEYSEEGHFEDNATQLALNRNFDPVDYQIIDKEDRLEIITQQLYLTYDKKPFSNSGLCIKVKGNLSVYHSTWYYGDDFLDLGGTTRTLDAVDGETKLERGLLSRNGFSVIDDSESLIWKEDGFLGPREQKEIDLYFLGYGRDYLTCLKDYFKLTGSTPLLPRYALGNWWSRYHRYTDTEYRELMERFEKEEIPISVAVIDMDWHLVDIDKKYGSGWTGYTWNRELFPDPKSFLDWLHKKQLHVTLNVHPAEGVRAHECMYREMAMELGYDYDREQEIPFDASDPAFLEAYFKYLHNPNEDIGVDFWWIDWQQGNHAKVEGFDPLWILNHFHYLDIQRKGKRPLILSRFAGAGSHRYPVGFSGDSIISWASLKFQPYFTATASNIGYCWWSHDIGGHMLGIKNEELATRWLQFGVFSPIMRLHSSSSIFNGKEPWNYSDSTANIMREYMQLRHRLIPYLYTMNYLCHKEGLPLLQPMYYKHPEDQDAYQVPNEYYFGTQLIVHPITEPMNMELGMGVVNTWLPEGIYLDFFTGLIYSGNRNIKMYRRIENIPVLAKAGAIVVMAVPEEPHNGTDNPKHLELNVIAGDNGEFTLYEDDGITMDYENGRSVQTRFELAFDQGEFMIHAAQGELGLIPKERSYTIQLTGFVKCGDISVFTGDGEIDYRWEYCKELNRITVTLSKVPVEKDVHICFREGMNLGRNDIRQQVFRLLNRTQLEFRTIEMIYDKLQKDASPLVIADLQSLNLNKELLEALSEIILSKNN